MLTPVSTSGRIWYAGFSIHTICSILSQLCICSTMLNKTVQVQSSSFFVVTSWQFLECVHVSAARAGGANIVIDLYTLYLCTVSHRVSTRQFLSERAHIAVSAGCCLSVSRSLFCSLPLFFLLLLIFLLSSLSS